jgi:hypothetical protein
MAVVPLTFYGCATQPMTPSLDDVGGHISARQGRPGHVVAAPHGSSDTATGDIATAVAQRTGYGLVIATGFSVEADTRERPGRRYQVNRPREGVPGRPAAEESVSEGARRVYDAYERRVRETAQTALVFYAEIHGNNHRESATQIQVATVGVDREAAFRLRALLELVRDAHLRGHPDAPRLQIMIEPADSVRYSAAGAKRDGILRLPRHALHVELPQAARTQWRETYTAILGDFLLQAPGVVDPALAPR